MTSSRQAVWISKRDAIGIVISAAVRRDSLSRSGARTTLRVWVAAGKVRTTDGDWPSYRKLPSKLYRLADIERCIALRARVREWRPDEDAMLGTDHDPVIAKKIRRPVHQVYLRRRALGVMPHQRRAHDGPNIAGRPSG